MIDVLRIDIKKGKAECGARCPIALAVLRRLKELGCSVRKVHVGAHIRVYPEGSDEVWIYSLPRKADDFISMFDTIGKHAVAPMSFRSKLVETKSFAPIGDAL